VDNIPLLAAKNEYMVSNIKNQATTFRPILDDINYNAGKLWSLFTIAVKRLSSAIIRQKENSDKFKGTIEKFDRTLKERKVAKPGNVGNGGYRSFKKQNVAPVPKVYNVSQIMEDTTPIIRPFNLPTQVVNSQPPEIPTLQNKATGVELIDPINPLNPYMMLVPGILGII